MDEKEIEVIVKNSDGDELERTWVRVGVEKALVGKWLIVDLSATRSLSTDHTLEIWTGTICD